MFNYKCTVDIQDAPAAIIDLVSTTRLAIMRKEFHPSGSLIIVLDDKFALSIVNNSHAFNDDWEGAATLEVALLKNGTLVCGEDGYNELTSVNGIDYHKLENLFKQVRQKRFCNIFKLWVECYRLTDSRFFVDDEYVNDLLSNKAYLADVKRTIYA